MQENPIPRQETKKEHCHTHFHIRDSDKARAFTRVEIFSFSLKMSPPRRDAAPAIVATLGRTLAPRKSPKRRLNRGLGGGGNSAFSKCVSSEITTDQLLHTTA